MQGILYIELFGILSATKNISYAETFSCLKREENTFVTQKVFPTVYSPSKDDNTTTKNPDACLVLIAAGNVSRFVAARRFFFCFVLALSGLFDLKKKTLKHIYAKMGGLQCSKITVWSKAFSHITFRNCFSNIKIYPKSFCTSGSGNTFATHTFSLMYVYLKHSAFFDSKWSEKGFIQKGMKKNSPRRYMHCIWPFPDASYILIHGRKHFDSWTFYTCIWV